MGSSLAGDISRGADGPDPKIEVVDKGEANALGRGFEHRQWEFLRPEYLMFDIWVCLKIGYIPNYSHLLGIMIINH